MKPKRQPNKGSFAPGPDQRRHRFTTAERSKGFYSALAAGAPYHWVLYRIGKICKNRRKHA